MQRLFINLSNHPSAGWSEEQKAAAAEYGDIEDMAFPAVDPDDDEEKIAEIADSITEAVLKKAFDHDVTVHVMGEMTLTFAIVSRLTARGITCLSSTSERMSQELPDGSKLAMFKFQKFRKYGE